MTTNNTAVVATKNRVRFASPQGTLDVLQRPGKTGFSVFVRVKPVGQRAVIGCRNVLLKVEDAAAKFALLVAETEKAGWTRRVTNSGATASKFDTVPAPNALPASTPLAAKKTAVAAGPKAVAKVAAGGKR